jgi:predicted membrane protein
LAGVYSPRANEEETDMPVLIMWAIPAVIVVGGVGYYLVRAVH